MFHIEREYVHPFFEVIAKLTFIQFRNSRPEVFCKKGVLKNFAKFTRKHFCRLLAVLLKKILVFSCKFFGVFKNNFFVEHLQTAASASVSLLFCLCTYCFPFASFTDIFR